MDVRELEINIDGIEEAVLIGKESQEQDAIDCGMDEHIYCYVDDEMFDSDKTKLKEYVLDNFS